MYTTPTTTPAQYKLLRNVPFTRRMLHHCPALYALVFDVRRYIPANAGTVLTSPRLSARTANIDGGWLYTEYTPTQLLRVALDNCIDVPQVLAQTPTDAPPFVQPQRIAVYALARPVVPTPAHNRNTYIVRARIDGRTAYWHRGIGYHCAAHAALIAALPARSLRSLCPKCGKAVTTMCWHTCGGTADAN